MFKEVVFQEVTDLNPSFFEKLMNYHLTSDLSHLTSSLENGLHQTCSRFLKNAQIFAIQRLHRRIFFLKKEPFPLDQVL